MKPTFLAALFGAGLTAAAFLAAPAMFPQPASAADAPAEAVPTATRRSAANNGGPYKILSLAPWQNDVSVRRMEEALNALAAQGWKVKTSVGISLILER